MAEEIKEDGLGQFRTVVTGYRLHGILVNKEGQTAFQLSIQSSVNKDQKYRILFDLNSMTKVQLNQIFQDPTSLFQYLSKITKTKIKFNSQSKQFIILGQKQKNKKQYSIKLTQDNHSLKQEQQQQQYQIIQKGNQNEKVSTDKQNQSKPSSNTNEQVNRQKQQIQIQNKNQYNPIINNFNLVYQVKSQIITQAHISTNQQTKKQTDQPTKQSLQPIDLQAKIQQLRKLRQQARLKQEGQKPIRQPKQISYTFIRKEHQSQNLYEYAFSCKMENLADLIENQQLDKTEEIVLKRCKVQDVPPFNQIALNNIKFLSLEENKIKRIQNLQNVQNLQKLNLDGNKLLIISNISHLTNLKILKLGNNQIQKIEGLQNLSNLQMLWLDFNSLQRIQNLTKLTKLKSLNLSFNMIQKIQNLQNLTNLQQLLLNENQITQIQNIQNLSKLIRLSLNMNSIVKIKGLKKLLLLEVVYLSQNQIQSFDKFAFQELNWLKMLKQLKLGGNYIQWNEEAKNYVERLRKYGVKVNI